jgi:hypothetical protein
MTLSILLQKIISAHFQTVANGDIMEDGNSLKSFLIHYDAGGGDPEIDFPYYGKGNHLIKKHPKFLKASAHEKMALIPHYTSMLTPFTQFCNTLEQYNPFQDSQIMLTLEGTEQKFECRLKINDIQFQTMIFENHLFSNTQDTMMKGLDVFEEILQKTQNLLPFPYEKWNVMDKINASVNTVYARTPGEAVFLCDITTNPLSKGQKNHHKNPQKYISKPETEIGRLLFVESMSH